MILRPQLLTREAFRPFGDVIACAGANSYSINDGCADRYHDLATLALTAEGGRPVVSIFRTRPRALPFSIALMERHPLSSQAFMPLHDRGFLIVVAPAGAAPAPDALTCFWVAIGMGINFAAGTWHHPLIALDAESDFLVIDRAGPGTNCDEIHYAPAEQPVIEAA